MLTGTLDDFTLADIFKLLSFSKKTGRVELKRKAGMGRVFFRDGEVYFAESSLSREPLGQKLVRSRALTDSHLRQALDDHSETGERVGQILLRHGWIDEEQLESAVKQQIEDAVFDLLRWELGDFEWEPDVTLEPEVPISVSVENLIMESSRRLDELEVIGRKIPSSQAVVAVAPAPPEGAVEINITPDEWRVLVLVDGHRTVETIANTIGLDEFQTMRIVHGMVSAGLIEVTGSDEGQETLLTPPPPPPLETDAAAPPAPPVSEDRSGEPEEVEANEGTEEPTEGFTAFDSLLDEPDRGTDGTAEAEAESSGEEAEERSSEEEALVEETLYEAPVASGAHTAPEVSTPLEGAEVAGPPAEWFEDPDISMELFDTPATGEVITEVPAQGPDAGDPAGDEALSEAALRDDVEVPEGSKAEVRTPPPPPVAQAEGPERTRAVRDLADLFEDVPVDRAKRPVIRRIEPVDPAAKRRVEDDEQVTKGLISRLIEGVKGL